MLTSRQEVDDAESESKHAERWVIADDNYEACQTIFYQGNSQSFSQIAKYTGDRWVEAPNGGFLRCEGINNLQPLDIIDYPYIGPEIADVNLNLFDKRWSCSHFNLLKRLDQFWAYAVALSYNYKFIPPATSCFGINREYSSIGQETDILSCFKKYDSWKNETDRAKGVIAVGISRGTPAIFCAMAESNKAKDGRFSEVKLVILEGAIDSIENVKTSIQRKLQETIKLPVVVDAIAYAVKRVYFPFRYRAYKEDGPSPLKSVEDFPEKVPVIFVTSEADELVPCENTERIANALADRNKNPVFLVKLKHSKHATYMFDDAGDREKYQCTVHAAYKEYGIKHNPIWAEKGKVWLEEARLNKQPTLSLARN